MGEPGHEKHCFSPADVEIAGLNVPLKKIMVPQAIKPF